MMRLLTVLTCIAFVCGAGIADGDREAPQEASTTAEILAAVDSITGEVSVNTVEVLRYDVRIFVVWYCPYWGREANKVYAYSFDTEKGRWMKFLDREFATDVTVEVGHIMTIRDDLGTVFRKPWW